MKTLPRLGLLGLLALGTVAAQGATRIDLDRGWSFSAQRIVTVVAGTMPAPAETVDLPHTWNHSGASYDKLGEFWYSRALDLPKLPADAIAQLNFGAVFYKARVFVNGKEIGTHEGGYSAFSFDVSDVLREHNLIEVAVDNRPGMYTIPGFGARGAPDAWYDWWDYGGITRDVWLDVHGAARIANPFIRSRIVGGKATVTTRVTLARRGSQPLTLRLNVTAPDGRGPSPITQTLEPGATDATATFSIDDPQLWDLGHARFYRLDASVLDSKGDVQDSASERFALRTIEIRDRYLLLNGRRVRLTGMTRHADSPWEGAAETRGTILHDWADMKSLDMTLTRPVHYQPDPRVLDYADEHGILLIPEIPVWQASEQQLSNPQYLALAKQLMRELIEQAGNHPSVMAWSVMNESAAGSPGGIGYVRAMKQYIRQLDPGRFVTLADDNLPKLKSAAESAANDADFLMMNEYFGAWHGPREALAPALDRVNALFPDKMVIISEMGYPGIFAKNPADADPTRVAILREQLPLLAQRDWIAGAILWCYQDYKSRRYYWAGQEGGYLEHGIVDPDRQRKPSYFAWRELNEPLRASLAWTKRDNGIPTAFEIKVTLKTPRDLPYHAVDDYRTTWQLTGPENRELAHGEKIIPRDGMVPLAGFDLSGTVPELEKPGQFQLVFRVLRPDGSVAMERSLASQ